MTVDVNDGIIATAGIVEGFSGAGAGLITLIIAAVSAMIAGTMALAGAKYAEAAGDRDAEIAVMEEERRQLALSPQEEFAELVEHYRARGLSDGLARQVAGELTAQDALGAHLRAEHGLSETDVTRPTPVALLAGVCFAVGSGVPLLAILIVPADVPGPGDADCGLDSAGDHLGGRSPQRSGQRSADGRSSGGDRSRDDAAHAGRRVPDRVLIRVLHLAT